MDWRFPARAGNPPPAQTPVAEFADASAQLHAATEK